MTRTATEEQPSPQAPRNRRFMTRCPFALENQFVLLNHYTPIPTGYPLRQRDNPHSCDRD